MGRHRGARERQAETRSEGKAFALEMVMVSETKQFELSRALAH